MSESAVQERVAEAHRNETAQQRSWRGMYRLGAMLSIATGFLWVVLARMGVALYPSGVPTDPASYLQLISHNQPLANATWALWDVADFVLIVPTVALYLVLRHYNKTLALLGAVIQLFFVFYDVSVTELNSLTLVSLSQGYSAAATDALKASYLGAATYGYAALPLETVLSFGTGTFAFLLWCWPMSRSIFRRRTAIFGAIVNAIGVAGAFSPVAPGVALLAYFQFVTLPGVAIWLAIVGAQLYRHVDQVEVMDGAAPFGMQPAGIER